MATHACSFDGGPWDGREVALPDPGTFVQLMKKPEDAEVKSYATGDQVRPHKALPGEQVGVYRKYGTSYTYLWQGWGFESC